MKMTECKNVWEPTMYAMLRTVCGSASKEFTPLHLLKDSMTFYLVTNVVEKMTVQ